MSVVDDRGIHPFRMLRKLKAQLGLSGAQPGLNKLDLKGINNAFVKGVASTMPHDEAMELAIGGHFAVIGPIEAALLRHYGLAPNGYLVDVGCGSGRLAKPLSSYLTGPYLGTDLVPDLLAHARKICQRPDWRFEVIDHIVIPEKDGRADMVCFFSVLTHLLHEQSYWYLQEAARVLKPGGRVVFSFLEFPEPAHWAVFLDTVEASKQRHSIPLNVFIDRAAIAIWAESLGLQVVEIRSGQDTIVAEGPLGQSICVLQKA